MQESNVLILMSNKKVSNKKLLLIPHILGTMSRIYVKINTIRLEIEESVRV